MTINERIERYKNLAAICADMDYADKKSVKAKNKAVDEMYEIVSSLTKDFGENGIREFEKLLNINENKTNVWASVHLLEKLTPSDDTKSQSLKIIYDISLGNSVEALGFRYWLKDWESKII